MGAGPQAVRIIETADPDLLLAEGLNGILGADPLQREAHEAGRWRLRQQGLDPSNRLQSLPELLAAGLDLREPIGIGTGTGQEFQRCAEAAAERYAGGGHFKAAGIAVPVAAAATFVSEAAPADQGGLRLLQQPFGEGYAAEALRAAAPFMTREGINIGGPGGLGHRHRSHRLGGIHQQPGLIAVLLQPLRHRRDRHHAAAVPEQM